MTPQELKNSILQQAIQGKLVEQRPEEGTAEELYQQIQAEKQRLIKEKKIKKDKPLPEITEEEKPFDIPESWKWVRLGYLVENITSGSRDWAKFYSESGDIFLRMGNLSRNSFQLRLDKIQHVALPNTAEGMRTVLMPGDLLFSITGEVGMLGLIPEDLGTAYINQHTAMIRFMPLVKNRYIPYLLLTDYAQKLYKGHQHGIKNSFRLDSIAYLPIPLPPLSEQQRIVAKIEELLPLIDRYEAAWSRLEAFNKRFPEDMQKSILQQAIQGKLVEQRPEEGTGEELYQQIQAEKQALIKAKKIKKDKPLPEITEDEKPYPIPENWTWVRFGDLGSYKKGPFGSALTKSMFVPKSETTVKVYEQKNAIQKNVELGEYYITREYFEAKMQGFEVLPGDIIVSCAGTIGETFVMPEHFEQGIINQALMRMKIFKPLYIPYFLVFFDFVLKNNARSGSKGSAIKNIPPFEVLKNYLVPLPPLAEQKRIVAKIEQLLPLCERLK